MLGYIEGDSSTRKVKNLRLGLASTETGALQFAHASSANLTIIQAGNASTAETYTLPTTDGTSGQVLSTNGSGVLSWIDKDAVPATITVANEATDTTCFPLFATAATGDLGPKSNTNLKFDSSTGAFAATSIVPSASDSGALGSASLQWSDLFLASGAVFNFSNGNWVATHTSGILTVGTGDLRVTTAGTNTASVATVGGTQTLTSKTLTSPTITTASLSGAQQLAEGASIKLDTAGSADGAYSGITITGTAGTTVAYGDLVYLAAADSRWELADADAASTSGDVPLAMVLAAGTDGSTVTLLLYGNIRADAAFPALTIGAPAYVSTTAGDIQVAQPSGTDDVIRRVGFALTADELLFNPSNDYVTHT